ncbi:unnamed protein product [Macrosiphum euphorbiae]|uniref:DUF5641 domain-containing protein n=1 Tax=Macrosiphum euphorbiae TaxID=13131 RepID=A0AAV0VY45_9HEMI|nr:unnamed protein product [Macrosiphum euphorbiae]
MDAQEKQRLERHLQRAISKRDKHVRQMLILFKLSQTVDSDPASLPMFIARNRDLESLMADFRVDQDDVMEKMSELGLMDTFEREHTDIETVVTDQYYSIQAVAGAVACCKSETNSSMTISEKTPTPFTRRRQVISKSSLLAATKEREPNCYACQGPHYVYKCEKFKGLPTSARSQLVRSNNMCLNCLSGSHTASACPSKYSCRTCSGKHHSLLHFEPRKRPTGNNLHNNVPSASTSSGTPSGTIPATDEASFVGTASIDNLSVLGTAIIRICNQQGQWVPVRALIDCGSQISAITTKCASRLGLTRCNRKINVIGLSQSPIVQAKGVVVCTIVPLRREDQKLTCEPVVLSKITGLMPSKVLDFSIRNQYMDLELADPNFDRPGQIEFLLGADVYNHIFVNGYHVRHTPELPSAFETTLGWIIVGSAASSVSSQSQTSLSLTTEPSLKQLLNRFWEVEEPVVHPDPFTEEQKCEEIFRRTTARDPLGRYSVSFPFKTNPSVLAKIYDPLGALAPITFWAKCFMQLLWRNGYDWDQSIPDDLAVSWNSFSTQLPSVSRVKLRRYIPIEQCTEAQLIGFSDASKRGYSAVVYLRLSYGAGSGTVHLLTARSKVAPLNNSRLDESLSVPRLELCGALLLAQTLHRAQSNLSSIIHISSIHAWTDSTVVLSWLTTRQLTFKVFVTNRLNKINELLPSGQWRYVPSLQNPADCVSRGLLPNEALQHNLYWDGPSFLQQSPESWTSSQLEKIPVTELPEQKTVAETLHVSVTPTTENDWLDKFSSLTRLKRVVVYIRRFIVKARHKSQQRNPTHRCDEHPPMLTGFLRHEELREAQKTLVQITQLQAPNLPPTLWKMGRVEEVHPGEDGVVRVVSLRTSDGTLKRPVVKLALLPTT